MAINVNCSCGAAFPVGPEWAGKQIKCMQCGNPLQVPGAAPNQPTQPVYSPQPATQPPQAYNPSAQPMQYAGGAAGGVSKGKSRAMVAAVVASLGGVVAAGGAAYMVKDQQTVLQEQLTDLQQRAKASDDLRAALDEALTKEKERVKGLQENAKKVLDKQTNIRTKLAEQDTKVSRLQSKIAEQQTAMEAALAQSKQPDVDAQTKADAKKKADELQGMIDTLTAEAKVAKDDADQLRKELTAMAEQVKEALEKAKEGETKLADLQSQINALPPAGDTIIDRRYVDQRTIHVLPNPTPPFPNPFPNPNPNPGNLPIGPIQKNFTLQPAKCRALATQLGLTGNNNTLMVSFDTATANLKITGCDFAVSPISIATGALTGPPGLNAGSPGRYDCIHTECSVARALPLPAVAVGDVYDFVILDTWTGEVWFSKPNGGWEQVNTTMYQRLTHNSPRFRLTGVPNREEFIVTNFGAPISGSNSWINTKGATGRNVIMVAVP